MSTIGYGYGSEWHLLRWLGYHRAELSAEVERVITKTASDSSRQPGKIEWLDLAWNNSDRLQRSDRLHYDSEWEGIKFIAHPILADDVKDTVARAWEAFWPNSGTAPCWDVIGVITSEDSREWLLVDAKAHLKELSGGGCGASADSRRKIEQAFVQTQTALGIYSATDIGANDKLMSDWLGTFYQFANRLAVLYFFNIYLPQHHQVVMPARLIDIYFIKESQVGWKCPETEQVWSVDIDDAYTRLGLVEQAVTMRHLSQKPMLLDYSHELYLPVLKP